jgi:hypothetical protein
MNKKDFLFLKRKRESKGKVLGACSKEGAKYLLLNHAHKYYN